MGYPKDLLSTRAIISHGRYALIPPEGRVNNVIPNFVNCKISIIADPKMGASFAFYTVDILPGGKTITKLQETGIETFVFCRSGQGKVIACGQKMVLEAGGYVFVPASEAVEMENSTNETWNLLLYKQRYRPLEGHEAKMVVGNLNNLEEIICSDMENLTIKNLLPLDDLGFDVSFHTLTFDVDASHPFVETHVQEHGLYFLQGQGMYLVDNQWIPVKKEDFLWFGPYVPQTFYCTGREKAVYIYTKDCNRDVEL